MIVEQMAMAAFRLGFCRAAWSAREECVAVCRLQGFCNECHEFATNWRLQKPLKPSISEKGTEGHKTLGFQKKLGIKVVIKGTKRHESL